MNKNKKKILLGILLLFFLISIGFALLTTTLNIEGNTTAKANTWNIYFDNIQVKEGSITPLQEATINQSNKTQLSFNVDLNLPGDFYEFDVDVVNAGTIDAMIDTYEILPVLTTEQAKFLDYTIKYTNGASLGTKDILPYGSIQTLNIKVALKSDINNEDLLSSNWTFNPSIEINYIQADSTAKVPAKMINFYINDEQYSVPEGSTFNDFYNSLGEEYTKTLYYYNLIDGGSQGHLVIEQSTKFQFSYTIILYADERVLDDPFIYTGEKYYGVCSTYNYVDSGYGLACGGVYTSEKDSKYKLLKSGKYLYINNNEAYILTEFDISDEMKINIENTDYKFYAELLIQNEKSQLINGKNTIDENTHYTTVYPEDLGIITKVGSRW